MGTRADLYVGRGKNAEWLGSFPWDGYPDGDVKCLFEITDEATFRQSVTDFLTAQTGTTFPPDGWPWPWTDSTTTDYSYAFDNGKVWASWFGHLWFDPLLPPPDLDTQSPEPLKEEFPDMTDRQNVTYGERSGLLVLRIG